MGAKNGKYSNKRGVLSCGAYGHGNAGDEAILEAIVREMRSIDPDMPITVLSRTPEETARRNGVTALHTFNVAGFLRVMRRSKLFLNGGGSLIQDVTSSRSLWYYLFTLFAAKCSGCRVLMYGCGIGPVHKNFDRRLVRRILNKYVDAITLREEHSLRELESFGVTKPECILSSDPALTLPAAESAEVDELLRSSGMQTDGRYAAFCLRRWPGFQEKAADFAEAARYVWEKYALTPVFISINHRSDGEVASQVAALMGSVPHFILSEPMPTPLTIGLLSRMELVLSMRLHGLIFAASQGVPLVGVAYDPKVTAFLEYAQQENHLPFEDVRSDRLCTLLDAAALERGDRAALAAEAELLRAQEYKNTEAARRLLQS